LVAEADSERLVKSAERVRDLGEVFTPAETVNAMLDSLPTDVWRHHPSRSFLEPACGDGNFLVAVLGRKLGVVAGAFSGGSLVAGASHDALEFHGLEALASIYAVDISVENVIGGAPGHETGARERLVAIMREWHTEQVDRAAADMNRFARSSQWIVDRNVLVGNMLAKNSDGTPSGRNELPILEYAWEPRSFQVTLFRTTLGDISAEAALDTSDSTLSLFGPREPTHVWTGPAMNLCLLNDPAPDSGKMPSNIGVDR